MGFDRRARAFTLIEVMIVVTLVGVLALIATLAYRRWVHTAYLNEPQDMVANIRAAEEAFKAENGGYLTVTTSPLGPPNDYPATTPGAFKTAWGADCAVCVSAQAWSQLNIQPNGPLAFGYSLVANNDPASQPPAITVNGQTIDLTAVKPPWYVVEADGDMDGNTVFTKVYGISATNRLFIENEGE